MISRFPALLLVAVALAAAPAARAAEDLLAIGQPFPVLPLPVWGSPDRVTTIEEFRGKKVMLHLFASW